MKKLIERIETTENGALEVKFVNIGEIKDSLYFGECFLRFNGEVYKKLETISSTNEIIVTKSDILEKRA